jgi:hypothetical protein
LRIGAADIPQLDGAEDLDDAGNGAQQAQEGGNGNDGVEDRIEALQQGHLCRQGCLQGQLKIFGAGFVQLQAGQKDAGNGEIRILLQQVLGSAWVAAVLAQGLPHHLLLPVGDFPPKQGPLDATGHRED